MYMSEFRLRVSSFLIRGNSKSFHLGVQSTFKCFVRGGRQKAHDPIRSNWTLLRFVPYKIFVCAFGDCAQFSTMMGTEHLLDAPQLYFAINTARYLASPPTPCAGIRHAIFVFVFAISCKGQTQIHCRRYATSCRTHRSGEEQGGEGSFAVRVQRSHILHQRYLGVLLRQLIVY